MIKSLVLVSGGLDSAVSLALALEQGRKCLALSFNYGQKHKIELEHAKKITEYYSVDHKIITIEPAIFGNSSLTSKNPVHKNRSAQEIAHGGIPSTYVPGRNTLFLAYAAGQAEIYEADEIIAGPNFSDRLPYPDCRPEFYHAFQQVLNFATKRAVEIKTPVLKTPLIDWDKQQIVKEGIRLKVPLNLTFSCYDPNGTIPCNLCDACILRNHALQGNGL